MPKPRAIRAALAALAAVASLAAAQPASAGSPRFHGVVFDRAVAEAAPAVQDRQFALMRRTGVRSVRRVFHWSAAQPVAGEPPSFADTDAFVARAARNDIDVLPVVMYAPPWARKDASNFASPPANPQDYVAYLVGLIGRYGPSGTFWADNPSVPRRPLRVWQIWNEPQLRYQWAAGDWEAGYGELLRAAYPAVKRADPGAKVVLAAATNFAWDVLESLYEKGRIKGSFDLAALHPYTGSAARVLKAARLFRDVLRRRGDGRKPVWITELAWPASRGKLRPPEGLRALPTTARGMAARLTRAFTLLRRSRLVQRAYWYTWASGYDRREGIFDYTGLQRYDPKSGRFTPTPALRAFRAAAR